MALLDILTYPDPRLKNRAETVASVDDSVRRLIDDMFETMYQAEGVGLAAPQVGVLKRVIVLDCGDRSGSEGIAPLPPVQPIAVVNPVVESSEGCVAWQEGCLSVPGYTDEVERSARVIVTGLNREGEPLSIEAEQLLAVCLQHEIDHLEGTLFVDRLSRLKQTMVKKRLKRKSVEAPA
ncbi:MAG: peptide deformylase [Myxococcales bacterium]|nr:peptide deformylase [Myxococcales bacterium]